MQPNTIYGFTGERISLNLKPCEYYGRDRPDIYPVPNRIDYNPFKPPVIKVAQDRIQASRTWRMRQEFYKDYKSVNEFHVAKRIVCKVFKNTPKELFLENILKKYIYSRNIDNKISIEQSSVFKNLDT